jgi:hypothetical protein
MKTSVTALLFGILMLAVLTTGIGTANYYKEHTHRPEVYCDYAMETSDGVSSQLPAATETFMEGEDELESWMYNLNEWNPAGETITERRTLPFQGLLIIM